LLPEGLSGNIRQMSDWSHDRPASRSAFEVHIGRIFHLVLTREGDRLRREANRLREEFTKEKRDELLQVIEGSQAGSPVHARAQAELSYYLTMFQVNSAERGTRQLALGTWVLAGATIGLVAVTIILAVVTARHGG
jgi:hypothetical protein